MAALLSPALPNLSRANPSGSQVISGGVTITAPTDNELVVRQSTNSAIINWQGFSIGSGERTQFRQPSRQAVTLNRVVGGDLSRIDGQLQANGNLFLVNPNGVVFGSGARVDVGGLVATTADIANDDFLSGRYDFAIASPDADAMVINHGTISIADQGLAALVAPGVENRGLIVASLGSVTLGGAETFSLDLTGDGLLSFGVAGPVTQTPTDATALVNNSGTISAVGGSVVLTAEAAGAVVDNVINMSGVIEAQSAGVDAEGRIVLSGGATGLVEVSGTLDASGAGAGQRGGQVQVLGELVALRDGADIDVSGSAGGGAALVGGNFQGAGPLPNARRTLVEQGASINADATAAGHGGTVVVWADEVTGFMGSISARGGPAGGDGGLVETSGKQGLHVQDAVVDVGAPAGDGGQWLLDPANILVSTGGGDLPDVLFADGAGTDFFVDPGSLDVAAGTAAVLQAEFDIDIFSNIVTSGGSLVFQAGDDINVLASIDTNGGDLHLEAASPHASAAGTGIPDLDFGTLTIAGNFDTAPVIVETDGGNAVLIAEVFNFSDGIPGDALRTDTGNLTFARANEFETQVVQDIEIGAVGTGADLSTLDFDLFEVGGILTIGRATTAGSDGLGTDAITITNTMLTVSTDLNAVVSPVFGTIDLLQLIAADDVTVNSSIDTARVLATSGGTIDWFGDLNVTGDSAIRAADDILTVAAFTSNGANLFFEADSPHAGVGSDESGALILEDDTVINTGGGDLVLMGAAFDFANALHVTSGAGDTFIAGSTDALFDLGSAKTDVLQTPDLELLDGSVASPTTGNIVVGEATSSGTDGLGTGAVTRQADSILLDGTVLLTNAASLIFSSTGSVTQTAGSGVTAAGLGIIAGGDVDLSGDVDTLAVDAPGQTVAFEDIDDLDIGTVRDIVGAVADTLSLVVGTTVTSSAGILAQALGVTAGGDVDLAGDVDILAVAAPGMTVAFEDSDDLDIGTVEGVLGLTADTADLTTGGALTNSGGTVTVASLAVTSGGDVDLSGDVDTFAVAAPGQSVAFDDIDDLEIGTVAGVSGAAADSLFLKTGGTVVGSAAIDAASLAVEAGGDVDLFGDVDILAISAPGHNVAYFDDNAFNVGTVLGVTGITAEDVFLGGGTITFDVAHLINSSLEIFSDSANTVEFNEALDGPGDLFIESLGDVLFNAPVGAGTALGDVIIGSPITSFDDVAATLLTDGLEAASLELLNEGGDVTIASLFHAHDVLIKVNGTITTDDDQADAFDVAGLLVSGSSANVYGFVDGVGGLPAALLAYSDPPLSLDTNLDLVFGAFDETGFLLNDCIIETVCDPIDPDDPDAPDDSLLGTEDVNSITNANSNTSDDIKAAQAGPNLDLVTIFEPSGNEQQEFDERFSNTGNEEIW